MNPFPRLHRDLRQQVIQDHQVAVFPGEGFFVNGDIGQVVLAFLFRRLGQVYVPGCLFQGFRFRQGAEGGGFFLCLAQGFVNPQSAADQRGDPQQDPDLMPLQEEEGNRLDEDARGDDGAEGDQLRFCGLYGFQG